MATVPFISTFGRIDVPWAAFCMGTCSGPKLTTHYVQCNGCILQIFLLQEKIILDQSRIYCTFLNTGQLIIINKQRKTHIGPFKMETGSYFIIVTKLDITTLFYQHSLKILEFSLFCSDSVIPSFHYPDMSWTGGPDMKDAFFHCFSVELQ